MSRLLLLLLLASMVIPAPERYPLHAAEAAGSSLKAAAGEASSSRSGSRSEQEDVEVEEDDEEEEVNVKRLSYSSFSRKYSCVHTVGTLSTVSQKTRCFSCEGFFPFLHYLRCTSTYHYSTVHYVHIYLFVDIYYYCTVNRTEHTEFLDSLANNITYTVR